MWSDGERWSGLLGARPGGRGGSDLWMSTRADRASLWSAPVNLGPQVNSGNYEEFPHLTADGLELFFCRDNGSGAKLYSSRRANLAAPWQQAVLLPNYINFPDGQWLALPSPDGLTLFTGNIVSGSPYPADILVLTRQDRNSPWNRPVSLGAAINSPWNQAMPLVLTPDGSALYFMHDTGIGTIGNAYLIQRVELLPKLGIARDDSPTPKVTLSYSSIFNSAILETSDNLVDWAPVLQAAVVENGENRVALPVSNQGFFRLARP